MTELSFCENYPFNVYGQTQHDVEINMTQYGNTTAIEKWYPNIIVIDWLCLAAHILYSLPLDEWGMRFSFHSMSELPPPEPYVSFSKSYPSKVGSKGEHCSILCRIVTRMVKSYSSARVVLSILNAFFSAFTRHSFLCSILVF